MDGITRFFPSRMGFGDLTMVEERKNFFMILLNLLNLNNLE